MLLLLSVYRDIFGIGDRPLRKTGIVTHQIGTGGRLSVNHLYYSVFFILTEGNSQRGWQDVLQA